MKRVIFYLLLSTCIQLHSNEVVKLTMGHFASESHPANIAAKMFADNVTRRTRGLIDIKVYPNNQLGSPVEVLNKNIEQTIDMSLPTQGQLAQYSDKFGCIMIPFLFDNYNEVHGFIDGPYTNWVETEFTKQDLILLSNWEWGFRNITNDKRAIYSPSDVSGLSVRTPPELSNQLLMSGLGAKIKTIAWKELPMALKQNIVDGQENPLSVIYDYRIYETQKYMTMTRHTYNSMCHVISKTTWGKLSSEHRLIIKEESMKAGEFMRKKILNDEIKQVKELDALGMKISWPDIEEFKAAIPNVYSEMQRRLGDSTYKEFMQIVAEYKKEINR